MLFETVKMAKFFRVLTGETTISESLNETIVDPKNIVATYRDLLNNFFRLVTKLNKAAD